MWIEKSKSVDETKKKGGNQDLRKSIHRSSVETLITPRQPRSTSKKLTGQDRVDHLKGLIDLLANLGARQDNLTADEDEKDNLRLDHTIDQTREQLRFVRAEVMMTRSQTLQADGELDIARSHNVLNLEVGELGVESKFLDDPSVLARRQLGIVFRFRSSHHHLTRGEDERRRLGLTNSHDDRSETLKADMTRLSLAHSRGKSTSHSTIGREVYLWVILGVPGVKRNRLQVQTTVKIDRGDDVSLWRGATQRTLSLESSKADKNKVADDTHCKVGKIPLAAAPAAPAAPGVAAGVAGITPPWLLA